MAYQNQLDRSLKENSKDFRQNWGLSHVTSTPIYKRGAGGKLNSTRRYSLASVAQSPLVKPNKHSGQKNHSFDLSKKFDSYMSTHIDTQSPGYTSRVVQYSEENEKPTTNSHLRHYGLGSFPIVHFFKKDLPILSRKSLHVNNSVNSSELSSFNTPEQNKLLLERIIRSESGVGSPHKNEVNTKSVLDALREISRKRIHSEEDDFNHLSNDGKRMCLDFDNNVNGRNKIIHKPPQENSKSNIKGMIDELTASYSSSTSMEYENVVTPPKKKSIAVPSPPRPSPEKPKIKQSADVETQTLPALPEKTKDASSVTVKEPKVKKPSPVKIFDDKPLEAMRRKRLSILIGSHIKETPEVIVPEILVPEVKEISKPVTGPVSILTTSKSPQKVVKHVTFSLPSTTSDSSTSQDSTASPVCVVTNTTTSLITPIVFPSVSESSPKAGTTQVNTTGLSTSDSLKAAVNDALVVATTSMQNNFAFASTDTNKNSFVSGATQNMITTSTTQNTIGGFKFDLRDAQMPSFSQPSTTASMAFPVATTSSTVKSPINFPVLATTSASLPFATTSGFNSTFSQPSFTPAAFNNTSAVAPTMSSTYNFNFSYTSPNTSNTPLPNTFTPARTTTTTTGEKLPLYLYPRPKPAFAPPTVKDDQTTFTPEFAPAPTIIPFNVQPENLTVPNAFHTVYNTPPVYNSSNFQFATRAPMPKLPNFKFTANTTATPTFTTTPATTKSSVFGTTFAPPTTAAPPAFGTTSNQFSFNNTAFKPNPFGSTGAEIPVTTLQTTPFVQSTNTFATPAFGTGGGVFDKPASTSQEVAPFGSTMNNSFGGSTFTMKPPQTTAEAFSFGASNAKPPAVFSFGTSEPPKPAFSFGGADNNSNVFGGNKGFGNGLPPPAFGASTQGNGLPPPAFGASTQGNGLPPPAFGASTQGNGLPPPAFGASTQGNGLQPPAFGVASAQGNGRPPPAFGATSTQGNGLLPPAFGAASTQGNGLPPPAFGAASAQGNGLPPPAFGAASAQGNGLPPPAFGAASTQANMAGMFNIGTGGSAAPSRPRTQLKAKRRT